MKNTILSGAHFSNMRDLADTLLWYGDDLAADAIYAEIEARERAASLADTGNVVPLFPTDRR